MTQNASDLEDPYRIIQRLREAYQAQTRTLKQYQIACEGLSHSHASALKEIALQKQIIESLSLPQHGHIGNLWKQAHNKHDENSSTNYNSTRSNQTLFKSISTSAMLPASSKLLKNQMFSPTQHKREEYIPEQVHFSRLNFLAPNHSANKSSNENKHSSGDTLIEDFLVIGPDISSFKKLRETSRAESGLKVKPHLFFNVSKNFRQQKPEFLQEITKRAFSQGVVAKKRMVETVDELRKQLQFGSEGHIGEDYFVFTLKGDYGQITKAQPQPKERKSVEIRGNIIGRTECSKAVDFSKVNVSQNSQSMLRSSNPMGLLYVICLKVRDFMVIRDEKHYLKRELEVWHVDKVYALVSYYPFLDLHVKLLNRIQQTLRTKILMKVIVEKDDLLLWQLPRKVYEAEKDESMKEMLSWFLVRKPNYNLPCLLGGSYFGVLPDYGYSCEYALARSVCPVFFSTFAYEEMLLLLAAFFCEKTLVFISRSESTATLCALFLLSILSPFRFNGPLLLNCDSEKAETMIFEFPFAMLATLKTTKENLQNILSSFIACNQTRFRQQPAQHLLIDVDSNSIFQDPGLANMLEKLVISPSTAFKDAYILFNPCNSKSFAFPKKMVVESLVRPRNDYEKTEQQRRKVVRDFTHKIESNTTKRVSYRQSTETNALLDLLTEYIRSLAIDSDCHEQFLSLSKQKRTEYAKMNLTKKHPDKTALVEVLVQSQMYADYMDSLGS